MKTTKHLFIIAIIAIISILFSACKDSSDNIPKVSTLNCVKIDSNSILLRGQTDSKYLDNNYSYGFLLISANDVESDKDAENKLKHYQSSQEDIRNLVCTGANITAYYFRYTVSGLGPDSTKYFCAYASDGTHYIMGNVMKLTTSDIEPLITTESAVVSLSNSSVTVSATVKPRAKNLGDYSLWFELSGDKNFSDPVLNKNVIRDINSDWYSATYQVSFGRTYYYRIVMQYWSPNEKNSVIVYGETKSFTVAPSNISLTTLDAQNTGLFSGLLTGKIPEIHYNYECGFLCSETKTTFTKQSFGTPGVRFAIATHPKMDDGIIKCDVSVKPNTHYYYTAFVKLSDDACYFGETKSFTTSPFQFSINEADRITAHSVTLNCAYNDVNINIEDWTAGIYLSSITDQPSSENNEFDCNIWYYYDGNIKDIKINETATGLKPNTTYYYRPYIYVTYLNYYTHHIYFYGETKSFTTSDIISIDGAVDLGLSVLWATDNLGATTENPVGDYYAWGETEPKNSFYEKDYTPIQQTIISGTQYDAATAKLGSGWRMPTYEEIMQLINNCNIEPVTRNSVPGTLLTSNLTGNSIFIPITNYIIENDTVAINLFAFWSGQKSTEINKSYYCEQYEWIVYANDAPCYYGMPIRPVYDPLWDKKNK